MRNELYHHGIKGQKWGVRRFQNADGTRTAAGKARAKQELSDDEKQVAIRKASTDRAYKRAAAGEYENQQIKTIIDETGKIVGSAKRMSDDYIRSRPKQQKKLNLSKMSDQDMRSKINRELLERQYNQLFNPETSAVSKGAEILNNVLTVGGTALAVGSSAVSIALAIKQLKQ